MSRAAARSSLVVARDLPGAAGGVERRRRSTRWKFGPPSCAPRGDEADDRVDRLRPEPLRDERRRVLVQARVEVARTPGSRSARDGCRRRRASLDRLRRPPDGRVVHDDRLELQPDPSSSPAASPAASRSPAAAAGRTRAALDLRRVPLRVRRDRAVGAASRGPSRSRSTSAWRSIACETARRTRTSPKRCSAARGRARGRRAPTAGTRSPRGRGSPRAGRRRAAMRSGCSPPRRARGQQRARGRRGSGSSGCRRGTPARGSASHDARGPR